MEEEAEEERWRRHTLFDMDIVNAYSQYTEKLN